MLGIKINGEFLDISPGLELELENANPFLQFTDEISGQFSLPFEVDASPKNIRLLNYAGIIQKNNLNISLDAEIYDNGLQVAIGKIKIEKPTHNLNRTGDGVISCYFLGGISNFYQDIKDKKLRSIDVGGDRSFDWDGIVENTNGFWSHLYAVLNADPGSYDYAFYPVKNTDWPGFDYDINVMNCVYLDSGTVHMLEYFIQGGKKDLNRVVPFPYLKYVMQQALSFVGWRIEGDILNDEDFKKVTMINFQAIDWAFIKILVGVQLIEARDPVVFNLQDHLPDVTISEFMIALKNRFGWWYDFDKKSKVITIKQLQDAATGTVKNFKKYASPVVVKKVNQEEKIYALRNNFNPDISGGAPRFDQVELLGSLDEITDLPAAGDTYYGKVYLIVAENNYYINVQNDDESWSWVLYAPNIYDYEPAGANEEITTAATTVGMDKYDNYMDLVPRLDNQGNWFGRTEFDEASWGIILCFYHGLKNNKSGDPYPYGSSHIYDSQFNQVAQWALTFECKKAGGLIDVGLYELSWKPILEMLRSPEEFELTLNLPLYEYLQLHFGDRLIIDGVKMYITQMKPKIPYSKTIALETVRIS